MKTEYEITEELKAVKAKFHQRKTSLKMTLKEREELRNQIKALNAELQALLIDGADPCPECGRLPVGLHQPKYYEIRCISPPRPLDNQLDKKGNFILTCRRRHAKGILQQEAISNWNAQKYFLQKNEMLERAELLALKQG